MIATDQAMSASFNIDSSQSYLYSHSAWDISKVVFGDATPYGTVVVTSSPQVADTGGGFGSDHAFLAGTLVANINPGTNISFPGGSKIAFETTGDYVPYDPLIGIPDHPADGVTVGAN